MNLKKFLAVLTVLCLVLALAPYAAIPANAETLYSGTAGNAVTWTLDDGGVLTISGDGPMTDFESNGAPWYPYASSIKSVVIKYGVSTIGAYAFAGCDMTNISIPYSVYSIGDFAFAQCENLTDIVIPNSVSSLGTYAFYYCSALKSVSLSPNIYQINNGVFHGCSSLTDVSIPYGVESIGESAFHSCTALESITIPASVTAIDTWAFNNCSGLAEIIFEGGAPEIATNAFTDVTATAKYPTTYSSEWDKSVRINYGGTLTWKSYNPQDVIAEGECGVNVYWELYNDNSLVIYYYNDTGVAALDLSDGAMYDFAKNGTPWYDYIETISAVYINDGVTHIGDYSFYDCTALTDLYISSSVDSIGEHAFDSCTGLTEIYLPYSISYIGSYAFDSCTGLKEIEIPEYVTEISDYAFASCTGLTYVDMPDGITTIGEHAFDSCISLTEVELPLSVETISSYAFYNCSKLNYIYIPDGVETIYSYAFDSCISLPNIKIPATVSYIGNSAFRNCAKLTFITVNSNNHYYSNDNRGVLFNKNQTELVAAPGAISGTYTLPITVDTIHGSAFYGCKNLTGIVMPNPTEEEMEEGFYGVYNIGEWAFYNCTKLASVTLPENLYAIGNSAFHSCSALTAIEIPEYVGEIGNQAFAYCAKLDEIVFKGNAPEFGGSSVFSNTVTTAYYASNDETWTADVKLNYGGTVTWVSYDIPCLRIAGDSRFETAFKVADQLREELDVKKFRNIIVANGYNFADALAGSYLAVEKNAPILLADPNKTEINWDFDEVDDNRDLLIYIEDNLIAGGTVYILGGKSSVPECVENTLMNDYGITVVRLAGADRFITNREILRTAGVNTGDEVLVCTGHNFADSLSASATGKPILLVNNNTEKLTPEQKLTLSEMKAKGVTFTIIGGTGSVSAKLETALKAYGEVTRIQGASRYETSIKVAEKYFSDPENVVLASAWSFPDGLCGGVLANKMGAPLVLTATDGETAATTYVQGNKIENGLVLGGTKWISDDAVRTIFAMTGKDCVDTK